jgi:hypothetical protein
VVSHHLDGFLHIEVTGLLHPATGLGFVTFRSFPAPSRPKTPRVLEVFPVTRFTPFEDFPSPAAVPHHCGRCPPAVTVLPDSSSDRSQRSCRPPPAEAGGVHPYSHPRARLSCPEGRVRACSGDEQLPVLVRRVPQSTSRRTGALISGDVLPVAPKSVECARLFETTNRNRAMRCCQRDSEEPRGRYPGTTGRIASGVRSDQDENAVAPKSACDSR